jgi:hypothetical protein
LNTGRRGGKPATNHIGTTFFKGYRRRERINSKSFTEEVGIQNLLTDVGEKRLQRFVQVRIEERTSVPGRTSEI